MQILVTRFHLLLLTVTLAISGVGFLRIPPDFAFPAHWVGSNADWLWPRDPALVVGPALQILLLSGFFLLGRLLTKNHYAKSQHVLDPALTLSMTVIAGTQLGLLLSGIGSDLDFIRFIGFGLGALLVVLAVILFEAERHTYAGLRMPWPIRSNRAWRLVHRLAAIAFAGAAVWLIAAAWFDMGAGVLTLSFLGALVLPVLLAGAASLATRHWPAG